VRIDGLQGLHRVTGYRPDWGWEDCRHRCV